MASLFAQVGMIHSTEAEKVQLPYKVLRYHLFLLPSIWS